MIFTEFRFLLFFLVVAIIYWSLGNHRYRKIWLLVCSYLFYGAWDWRFLSLIVLSTVIDYGVGVMLSKPLPENQRKRWLRVSLCSNLGLLGFFKYFNFFAASSYAFFSAAGIPVNETTLNVVLPVGISFYTFQTMSYSIDVYRRDLDAVESPLDLAVYISFFPQLVAGPIVRAADFLPQLYQIRLFSQVNVRACLLLFLVGFFKKACVSDNLAPFIDAYFFAPELYTASSAWIAVTAYAVQIYCDFSGYTDMAIACAGLLGYEFCPNFNYPYFSPNLSSFWRNWHISLSTWLRDYLYIPLGGSRGTQLFTYRNLMITMVLGGLWHGAGWNFIIWGAMHGSALVAQRVLTPVSQRLEAILGAGWRVLAPLITFYFVCVTWIFFRASDFSLAVEIVRSFVLFDAAGTQQLSYGLVYVLLGLAFVHWLGYKKIFSNVWKRLSAPAFAAIFGLSIPVVLALMSTSYNAFIYFQF